MSKEIGALEDNQTWRLVDLWLSKKAIGSKWVYIIKYKLDGAIERYKARLVILENNQREGIDYNETFVPVAKMDIVCKLLAIAAARNWEFHQMDVNNAFLHGDLDEEVYMKPPPGYAACNQGKFANYRKSLYGLRQAPRYWFMKLATALKNYGFVQSYSDYSLFTYQRNDVHLVAFI